MTSELSVVLACKCELPPIDAYKDYTVFQTGPWISFVQDTQGAEPACAVILSHGRTVGRFVGLVVNKFGLRILGSPMRGWTTAYMGVNLDEGVSRSDAVRAVINWAFRELRCSHVEIMDRRLDSAVLAQAGSVFSIQSGFEIDLTKTEDALFKAMTSACRRCIRKAEASGVRTEVATDEAFANDYYAQLEDVFAKQQLIPTYSRSRVESLMRHVLPSNQLLLLRARDPNGTCIATGLFPAANDMMYFWGGASWRAYQHLRPNEALQWAAMRYWKTRGIRRYDMGGGGSYKEKYGGAPIEVPWLRASKYPGLELLRSSVRIAWTARQNIMGWGLSTSRQLRNYLRHPVSTTRSFGWRRTGRTT
jgi:hypothetical protein